MTIEFKKSLSKAIEKYQKHIDWQGRNKTFSNLQKGFVSKRVASSNSNRPTSAATSFKTRTQPMQGRFRRLTRSTRPMTAKTKVVTDKFRLGESQSNPFGTPGDEECLFSLEEHPHDDSVQVDPKTQTLNIKSGAITIVDDKKEPEDKEMTISPIFGHAKRFSRPQSAKPPQFMMGKQQRNRFSKQKFSAHQHATLELKRIFSSKKRNPYEESMKSYSSLSKPPMGRTSKMRQKPRPLNEDMASFTGMYNSEIDPRTTGTSFTSKHAFGYKGPIRPMSKHADRPSLRAYKSIDANCRRPMKAKKKVKK